MTAFNQAPTYTQYTLVGIIALLIRSATLYWCIIPEMRYIQPDSSGYHIAAYLITHTNSMTCPSGRPIFWRTPGYPWFLSLFYTDGNTDSSLQTHGTMHTNALWVQVIICSLLPWILFHLTYMLTKVYPIAWAIMLFSLIHTGFVLSSTLLLTDGLGTIFFTCFLYCILACIFSKTPLSRRHPYVVLCGAALSLSAFTWMRPMGQFVAIGTALLLLFSPVPWKQRIGYILFFLLLFFATLAPWFVRNYRLTESLFFCPLFGLYWNVFNAPKILARVENIPLQEAYDRLRYAAELNVREALLKHDPSQGTVICNEQICGKSAWPLIKDHPFYFTYDTIIEVMKTTFDLYAYQLIAIVNDCFRSDPLIEFLPEKIKDCLYQKPAPWSIRILAWTELIIEILLWIGIFAGLWSFVCYPYLYPQYFNRLYHYGYIWLSAGFFIGLVVMQTGGFGYARLRLPIEPLILILGTTFWWWYIHNRQYKVLT